MIQDWWKYVQKGHKLKCVKPYYKETTDDYWEGCQFPTGKVFTVKRVISGSVPFMADDNFCKENNLPESTNFNEFEVEPYYQPGDWVTAVPSDNCFSSYSKAIGYTFKIKEDLFLVKSFNEGEQLCIDRENKYNVNYRLQDIRYATQEEIDSVTKKELSKEELVEEAKRRYPIGCYVDQKTAYAGLGGNHFITKNNVDLTETDEGFINVSIGGIGVYTSRVKKWAEIISTPEVKPLTVDDLVEGEIYVGISDSLETIYKWKKDCTPLYRICNTNMFERSFNTYWTSHPPFRVATQEEKDWLNACIKANKFIPKEEALKEKEFILPEKWYCLYSNQQELDVMNKFFHGGWGYVDPGKSIGCSSNANTNHWYRGEKDYTEITFEQFKKYVLKEEVKFEVEKWSVGTYVVFCKQIRHSVSIGTIDKIISKSSFSSNLHLETIEPINAKREEKGEIKWFATLQEAEEFSKTLIQPKYFKCIKSSEPHLYTKNKVYELINGELFNDKGNNSTVKHQTHYPGFLEYLATYGNYFEVSTKEAFDLQNKVWETNYDIDTEFCPYPDGTKITCYIEGEYIDNAEIHYEGDKVYIFNNIINGVDAENKKEYDCSWLVVNKNLEYNTWEKGLRINRVSDVQVIPVLDEDNCEPNDLHSANISWDMHLHLHGEQGTIKDVKPKSIASIKIYVEPVMFETIDNAPILLSIKKLNKIKI